MAIPLLAPDPFDEEIEAMLRDPVVRARLDRIEKGLRNGTVKTYSHEEVRARLAARRSRGLNASSEFVPTALTRGPLQPEGPFSPQSLMPLSSTPAKHSHGKKL